MIFRTQYLAGRKRLIALTAIIWSLGFTYFGNARTPAPGERVGFNRDVRPILSDNCLACHGFDAKKRKAGLRLDTPEGALTPNKDGRVAIKPGRPEESELWKRLNSTQTDEVMPPPETHKTVTAEQKSILRLWIEQGASYQKHWSFEAISDPPVPLPSASSGGNPVDRFIAARLTEDKLRLSQEADRATLIRRLSFDLRGLPPTPTETRMFLADTGEDAYERLVGRFMDSPFFGEQMGRHWLDVARYADTHGLHLDNERQMWAYRDWVVKAFNRNLPYDQFTIEQLAGDLLPEARQDQVIATGFNRNNVTTGEGGAIDAEFVFRYAVDRTATTAQAWMGLTAGCAVCHDHKYDPLTQKEFYSLYAFFLSAADPAMDGNAMRTPPTLQLKSPAHLNRLAVLDGEIQSANQTLFQSADTLAYSDPAELIPQPPAEDTELVWVEDDFPASANGNGERIWITADKGPVFSGKRSLKRKGKGVTQDFFEGGNAVIEVPANAKLYAYAYLDPKDPPAALMLQFNLNDWDHRAVWGDIDSFEWGTRNTPARYSAGALPKAGEWVRLEVDADKLGLKAGDRLKGLAYTVNDGTVYWDKAGAKGRVDPARDSSRSMAAWISQNEGKEIKELPENIRKILKETRATNRTPAQVTELRRHYLAKVCTTTRKDLEPLHDAVGAARKRRDDYNDSIPTTFVFKDLEKPRDAFVMMRGQYDKPGEAVQPGVPAIFPPLKTASRATRLDLARWLVSPENPLTARVTVNRFWQQFFGTGLVKTSDDFGTQGELPSHPELLDWLAGHFQKTGWNVKALVRLLVTSAAYRQSSRTEPHLIQLDPENRLLARGARFRLDAEQLRDNALFVGGLIDLTLGGKGVKTYQPPNIWEPVGFVGSNTREYKMDSGAALYRRSIYTFFKRTAPAPFLSTFDAPNREGFCARRDRSNTPLQALQLMNDIQYFEAARGLAQRILREGGSTSESRLRYAYQLVLSRVPDSDEVRIVTNTLSEHLRRYEADPKAADELVAYGETKAPAEIRTPELAAWTMTANLLLNLDETVSRN